MSEVRHPSKVMHKVIHNYFNATTDKLLEEEPVVFRPSRNTVEQIFKCYIVRDFFHSFI